MSRTKVLRPAAEADTCNAKVSKAASLGKMPKAKRAEKRDPWWPQYRGEPNSWCEYVETGGNSI